MKLQIFSFRWFLLPATLALACGSTPTAAYSQIAVVDASTLAQSIKSYGQMVQQVSMQVQQLRAQLAAMQRLAEYPGRALQPTLQSLTGTMGQPNSLGYASPNVLATFQRMNNPTAVIPNWHATQTANTQATIGVMQQAMASTASQQSTLASGNAQVARMQQMNTGLAGHEQAMELQNTTLAYIAQELMLMRQQLMTQVNVQAAYYARQMAERAQADTTMQVALQQMMTPINMGPGISLSITP